MYIYDERGEPTFLGFRVEDWYGDSWVRALMFRENISATAASEILEHGGSDGGPMPINEAIKRCFGNSLANQ